MFGAQCHARHFESCLALKEEFTRAGVEHDWLVTTNESLIPRARNTSAATFLNTDYQKLLFIDADIEFSPNDVALLWNQDAYVIAGAYRMKRPDAPPPSAWVEGKLQPVERMTVEGDKPFKVDFAGTGFMMIDRDAFVRLQRAHPEWKYVEGHIGECWAFFQDPIVMHDDGERYHESEDFHFCRAWRQLGGDLWVHPGVQLTHWGQYGY